MLILMPRPTRIEYEGAFHHVMNRGRHQRNIFHDERYFELFLKTLEEACSEFSAIIHAYCLMTNHYHLLIETPKANLSQIMKHVNGIYTQRHNRLRKVDGPLFRGRYKSVLVDADDYLLQLSRYIHRNPLEVKRKMVTRLEDYPWSSYPAYINKVKPLDWLYRDKIYQMLGQRQRYVGYKNFVEKGVDEDIKRFYNKGNTLSVLGDKEFRTSRREEMEEQDLDVLRRALEDKPSLAAIVALVCKVTKQKEGGLREVSKGKRKNTPFRAFAIYVCHQYSQASHKEIAEYFALSHVGSVSYPLTRIRREVS